MTITIKLKTDNAAFDDNHNAELARILHQLAYRAEEGGTHYLKGAIQDSNGNTVGSVVVTGR